MRLIFSLAALFLSVILLQLSSGGVGPLDALTGLEKGFSKGQIGILGSSHFLGFFIGCWWAPRVMGSVGHSRAFAVFTSMGAIGMLGHTLLIDPMAWAVMRVASGLCVAGCYTVIEAWLQAKATNANRGRTMGVYRMVDISASLGAQMMIGALATVETYLAYNLLTLFCCASLLPLALTKASPPITKSAPRLRPLLALNRSPLAVFAVVVTGLTNSAYRMVGPRPAGVTDEDFADVNGSGWVNWFDDQECLTSFQMRHLMDRSLRHKLDADGSILFSAGGTPMDQIGKDNKNMVFHKETGKASCLWHFNNPQAKIRLKDFANAFPDKFLTPHGREVMLSTSDEHPGNRDPGPSSAAAFSARSSARAATN